MPLSIFPEVIQPRRSMLSCLRLHNRFEKLVLLPLDALSLFQELALDDTIVKRRVATTLVWNMCAFDERATLDVLDTFRALRLSHNLDLRIGTRILDSLLALPERVQAVSIDSLVYLKEIADPGAPLQQLCWAVDNYSTPVRDAEVPATLSFFTLVKLMEAFPSAHKLCNALSARLLQLYNTSCDDAAHAVPTGTPLPSPSLDETMMLLRVLTTLSHDACPAELRAVVIKRALTFNSLPQWGALAALQSFATMGCWNAVGAMLLKHHDMIAKASPGAWSACCNAAIKAKVQNVSSRRALLKRGSELRSLMSVSELELQCRCEQLWVDVCSSSWVSIPETVERVRVIQAESITTEQAMSFLQVCIGSKMHQQVAWVLVSALVHHIPFMQLEGIIQLMQLLRKHTFRHESAMQRLGLVKGKGSHLHLALEYFYFCEKFRISCAHPGNSLIDPADCILGNIAHISYTEALMIIRAMLVCGFSQHALMRGMLDVVSPAVVILTAQELYIVAACHRIHENDDKGLTSAIQQRAQKLVALVA